MWKLVPSVLAVCLLLVLPQVVSAGPVTLPEMERATPSIDPTWSTLGRQALEPPRAKAPIPYDLPLPNTPGTSTTIEAFDFDDNITTSGGFVFIPADPFGAVGPDHVLNVGNVSIQWFTKGGTQQNLTSLQSFFGPLSPVNSLFDPKCMYDQYENRFIVLALELRRTLDGDPVDSSRILVAVSKDSNPNNGWWFHSINSKLTIGVDTWADYPGLGLDDKAIYITTNQFNFPLTLRPGVRLWIVHKNWYNGPDNSATVTVHDAFAAVGQSGLANTNMPAHMYGTPPGQTGTFLVEYSGLSDGTNEYIFVIRVDDPIGTPSFNGQLLDAGNLETLASDLVDAPQSGTPTRIEVNDRRALDAVWRDGQLYTVATIDPIGAESGQATAHWWRVDTSNLAALVLADQGNVGGEDIGANTWTFFPSINVNACGDVAIGFSACNSGIYAGAYYATRQASDPAGTFSGSQLLAQGQDYYIRTFGGLRNRWGDYSSVSVDPADDSSFWVFNKYALTRGTPTGPPPEDGRWGQRWGRVASACVTVAVADTVGCVGAVVGIPVTVTNCSTEPADITLSCTVGGGSPIVTVITGLPAATDSVVTLDVDCVTPGMLAIDCSATATLAAGTGCALDQDSAVLNCAEACVTVTALDAATQVGGTALVAVEAENCATLPADITVSCPGGVPSDTTFLNVPASGVVSYDLMVTCTEVGNDSLECTATATLVANPDCAAVAIDPAVVTCTSTTRLNEMRVDQPSTDNDEYLELAGDPGQILDGLSTIVIGDATGSGAGGGVDAIVGIGGTMPGGGFWLTAEATFSLGATVDSVQSLNFENNDNVTYLLVAGINPAVGPGSDLDQNDDGAIDPSGDWDGNGSDDGPPFDFEVDSVALIGPPGDLIYSPITVGPDINGTAPDHVFLCSDLLEWRVGISATGVDDTPRAVNPTCPAAIVSTVRAPCIPDASQAADVTVEARSTSGADLTYTVNGGSPTTLPMGLASDINNVQTWEASIPGQSAGDLVKYDLVAYNANPDSAFSPGHGYFVGTMDIADLRVNDPDEVNLYVGCDARVQGVASSNYGDFSGSNTDWYAADSTSGINVFTFGASFPQPVEGDSVTVEGMLTQFAGKLEITDSPDCDSLRVAVTGTGVPVVPDSIACSELGEDLEGVLVCVRVLFDPALVGGTLAADTNYSLFQSGCESYVMRVDGDTDIPGMTITTRVADVYGLVTQFDNSSPFDSGYQVQPRSQADIQFLSAPVGVGVEEPVASALRLYQNFPNPFSRSTRIRFVVPGAAGDAHQPVRLTVFDVQGRLVATVLDGALPPGERTVSLDADALGESGSSGMYFYRLEVAGKALARKLLHVNR